MIKEFVRAWDEARNEISPSLMKNRRELFAIRPEYQEIPLNFEQYDALATFLGVAFAYSIPKEDDVTKEIHKQTFGQFFPEGTDLGEIYTKFREASSRVYEREVDEILNKIIL